MVATTNPISDPAMVPQITLIGINHLHNNNNNNQYLKSKVWGFAVKKNKEQSLTTQSFSAK